MAFVSNFRVIWAATLRFLLYNIRYAAGVGTRFHTPVPYAGYLKRSAENLDHITAFIRSQHPDIIGLVEVDSGSFRSAHLCQAEKLARQLGHYHLVQTKYGEESVAGRLPLLNKQGNAILSRHPLVDHRFHYFQHGVKRLVIEARLATVTIFLVHLALTFRKRHYQLEQLHQLVKHADRPVLVAGDFNVLWGEHELNLFLAASGLVNANQWGVPSHPSRHPRRQLDFILHSPEIKITDFQVPQVQFSDHTPLVCDFQVMQ